MKMLYKAEPDWLKNQKNAGRIIYLENTTHGVRHSKASSASALAQEFCSS